MTQTQVPQFADQAIQHLDALYRAGVRLTGDKNRAEDLVQDTYLRAFRYQESWKPGSNMRAWLYTIMRNLFYDQLSKNKLSPVSLDEIEGFEIESLPSQATDVLALEKIEIDLVRAAIDQLPLNQKEVLLAVDVEGLSYKETAEIVSVPVGTVMSRLHRARAKLGEQLREKSHEV